MHAPALRNLEHDGNGNEQTHRRCCQDAGRAEGGPEASRLGNGLAVGGDDKYRAQEYAQPEKDHDETQKGHDVNP